MRCGLTSVANPSRLGTAGAPSCTALLAKGVYGVAPCVMDVGSEDGELADSRSPARLPGFLAG